MNQTPDDQTLKTIVTAALEDIKATDIIEHKVSHNNIIVVCKDFIEGLSAKSRSFYIVAKLLKDHLQRF